jgi:hypothetical protein
MYRQVPRLAFALHAAHLLHEVWPVLLQARVIVAMEDGHGPYVLTGQVSPADAERLFMQHAAALTGVPLRRLTASGRRLRPA